MLDSFTSGMQLSSQLTTANIYPFPHIPDMSRFSASPHWHDSTGLQWSHVNCSYGNSLQVGITSLPILQFHISLSNSISSPETRQNPVKLPICLIIMQFAWTWCPFKEHGGSLRAELEYLLFCTVTILQLQQGIWYIYHEIFNF